MSSFHLTIHITLVAAQLFVFKKYADWNCDFESQPYGFIYAHVWCAIAEIISLVLHKWRKYEFEKLFLVSRIPIYTAVLFDAHFYELKTFAEGHQTCNEG
jgi:hypothetical protein